LNLIFGKAAFSDSVKQLKRTRNRMLLIKLLWKTIGIKWARVHL